MKKSHVRLPWKLSGLLWMLSLCELIHISIFFFVPLVSLSVTINSKIWLVPRVGFIYLNRLNPPCVNCFQLWLIVSVFIHIVSVSAWWNQIEDIYSQDWSTVTWNVCKLDGKHMADLAGHSLCLKNIRFWFMGHVYWSEISLLNTVKNARNLQLCECKLYSRGNN